MRLFITILTFCTFFSAIAQSGKQKKADKLFQKKLYFDAVSYYESVDKNKEVWLNLADSYFYTNQLKEAVSIYDSLAFKYQDSLDISYYFRHAQALMQQENYTKADPIMSKYLGYEVITPNYFYNLKLKVPYDYTIQTVTKLNDDKELGIAFFDKNVVFASKKYNSSTVVPDNYDLILSAQNKLGLLTRGEPFSTELNSKLNELNPAFSPDFNTVYFERNNDKKAKLQDLKYANKSIFRADLVNGKWTNIKKLSFCGKNFSAENPSISRDGKRLYFSSNRSQSIGGFDIFYVNILEKGKYSEPISAGNFVNTIHDEKYPFISDDNSILYFSSDGYQGMGGLDIFMSTLLADTFQNVLNLGGSINSFRDDYGYKLNDVDDKGFFTSDRYNGNSNMYAFNRTKLETNFVIQGNITDKNTKKPIEGAMIVITDAKGKEVAKLKTSGKSDFVFKAKPLTKYKLSITHPDYYNIEEEIVTTKNSDVRYVIELFKILK